jgi:hypothetical protein
VNEVDHRADEIIEAMVTWFQASQQLHAAETAALGTRLATAVAAIAGIARGTRIGARGGVTTCGGLTTCVRASGFATALVTAVVVEKTEGLRLSIAQAHEGSGN